MIMLTRSRCALRHVRQCALLMVAASLGLPAQAAEPSPLAPLAPEATVAYFELTQPQALLTAALDERWKSLLEHNEKWQAFWKSEDAVRLKAGIGTIEDRLQMPWHQALGELTGGGLAIAADPFQRWSLLVVRAKNAEILAKVRRLAIDLGQLAELASGKPSPLQAGDHRGIEVWSVGGQAAYALVPDEKLLIAGNRREDVVAALDRLLDGGQSLAQRAEFQAAQAANRTGSGAWGWLNLEPLRNLSQWDKLQVATRVNPGAESLAGGVIEALDRAPCLALQAQASDDRLSLRWQVPFDREQVSENRQWYFAPAGQDATPATLQPEGTILSVSIYRDHADMWRRRDQLFDEAARTQLTQADTVLGLLFSNRDFGSQVLGELQPGSRFVVARQAFVNGAPVPAVKLPAFAAVLELKNPDRFSTSLVAAFQALIGFVNVNAVQTGKPTLLQQSAEYRGSTLYQASYLPPDEPSPAADLIYNFSPTCAVVKNHFIVASTTELARQLIDELQRDESSRCTADNVRVVLNLEQLAAILAENERTLVTQNMLEKGNTRAEAEGEIAMVLRVLRAMGNAQLRLTPTEGVLELETKLGLPKLP